MEIVVEVTGTGDGLSGHPVKVGPGIVRPSKDIFAAQPYRVAPDPIGNIAILPGTIDRDHVVTWRRGRVCSVPTVQRAEIPGIPVLGQFLVFSDIGLPAGTQCSQLFNRHPVLVHGEHPVAAAHVYLGKDGGSMIIKSEIPVITFEHLVGAGTPNHLGIVHIEIAPFSQVKGSVIIAIIQSTVPTGTHILHHITGNVQVPVFGEFEIYLHRTVDFDSSKH